MLGKIENGVFSEAMGKVLRFNGQVITNPREEDWRMAGYKDVVDGEHLKEKEGYIEMPTYEDVGNKIKTTYHYEAEYGDVA